VLVSGMVLGTFFTLFVVPVIYTLLAAQHRAEPTPDSTENTQLVTA